MSTTLRDAAIAADLRKVSDALLVLSGHLPPYTLRLHIEALLAALSRLLEREAELERSNAFNVAWQMAESKRRVAAEARVADLERDRDLLVVHNESLSAEVASLREAVQRIAQNAEDWHGPNNAGSGHAKALSVIATSAREALAGGGHAAVSPQARGKDAGE